MSGRRLRLRRSLKFQEYNTVCAAAPVVEGHAVKGLATGEVILPATLLVASGCSGGVCSGRERGPGWTEALIRVVSWNCHWEL